MAGIVNIFLTFFAAVLVYESGHTGVGMLAFVLPVIAIWAWAMMLRYNPYLIKMRLDRLKASARARGLSKEEYAHVEGYVNTALHNIPVIPRWVRIVNALVFLIGVALAGWGGISILAG
ncbi:MAG TPA: hypothetical protein PLB81_08010 [Deltaproteobacteria bacterium]|nr:hypothetical protein [Deltaproteobacteria bacterium]